MKELKIGDMIMIGVILLAALGLFFFYLPGGSTEGAKKVIIEVDGTVVKTFDLPQAERIEYRVEIPEGGYNLVEIEGSRVRVVEADCPEQVDVKEGWIEKPGDTLVCLPHKMIVKIAGEKTEDDEIDVKVY